jgi:hypothetical protein
MKTRSVRYACDAERRQILDRNGAGVAGIHGFPPPTTSAATMVPK